MRLTTESANDAVNSLNWLAGHKDSSLTPRVHVEPMEKKAFCPVASSLCDEALRHQSTAPGEHQETDAALAALLKGVSDYSVSSSPGNLASSKKKLLFHSLRECTTAHTSLTWSGRQQRMRWDPEDIEGAALPQVYNDLVLKRNQKLYHSFVRDVKSRGMLSATLSLLEHVGMLFVNKSNRGLRLILDARRSNATFCLLLVCDCCLLKGSDESEVCTLTPDNKGMRHVQPRKKLFSLLARTKSTILELTDTTLDQNVRELVIWMYL